MEDKNRWSQRTENWTTTIRKLMGGGMGNLSSCTIFFFLSQHGVGIFFARARIFFRIFFPCTNFVFDFFALREFFRHPLPHHFSNG